MSRIVRRISTMTIILISVITLVIPAQKAFAIITIPQTLAQTSTDFGAGKFGLTGLAQNGGVQLIPLGVLAQWRNNEDVLCREVSDMGTAVFKNNIYLVGGTTGTSASPINLREVCRTKVLDINGNTDPWTGQDVTAEYLPEARTALSVVATPFPGDANKGMLYAIGGRSGGSSSSKNTIYSTVINADGSLAGWTAQAVTLPTVREKTAVTAYTNSAGTTFIYVLGGYSKGFGPASAYRDVLRYQVGANGVLTDTTPVLAADKFPIPIPATAIPSLAGTDPADKCADKVGLLDADAVNFDVLTEAGDKRMLALIDGTYQLGAQEAVATCSPFANATVDSATTFLAEIQEDGDLVWQTGTDYTMPQQLSQTRAVGINQKIFVAGGLLNGAATNRVYSSYVNEDLELNRFVDTNYLASTTALPVSQARAAHGLEIVTIPNPDPNKAPRPIVFMFGGISVGGSFRADVLYGFIGLDEDVSDQSVAYANPGRYTSPAYTLRGPGTLTEMRWNATITTTGSYTTDLALEYHIATSVSGLNSAPWLPIDGDPGSSFHSISGNNIATVTPPVPAPTPGKYFQYRVVFRTSAPMDKNATPVLRGPVSIKYTVDGHPSLYVKSASFPTIASVSTINPDIIIGNAKPPTSLRTESILDADIEAGGTFFVDLYVYPPGTTVVPPTRNAQGAYALTSAAFAEIPKNALPADGQLIIQPSTWKQNCGPTTNCAPANWKIIFNKMGTWNVIAIVDSQNNVNEADTINDEWETDNTFSFTVLSQIQGGEIFIPSVYKIPAARPAEPPAAPPAVRPTTSPATP
jgi:hypothetical protein